MAYGDLIQSTEYVKFIRGSQKAYDYLKTNNRLNADTLYFIYDKNDTSNEVFGKLYLGKILISDDSIRTILDFNIIEEQLENGQILVYNNGKWENQDPSNIAVSGSNTQVIQATVQSGQTDLEAIAAANPIGLHTGDLAVVSDGPHKRSYVYTADKEWVILNTDIITESLTPNSAIPLDSRSLFTSINDAMTAASQAVPAGEEGTYYHGQIIAVVENGQSSAYIIQPGGSLSPVSEASVELDNASLEENASGNIQVFGFNKEYYAWNSETSEYVLTSGFTSGLEPKVRINEDSQYEIAWFEPNQMTVEGIQSTVGTLQQTVTTLETTVQNLSENAITSVDENNFTVVNNKLQLTTVGKDQVEGLNELSTTVGNLSNLVTEIQTDLGLIEERLAWHDIDEVIV